MSLVDFAILAALPEEFLTTQKIFGHFQEITENADSWYRTSIKGDGGRRYQVVASFMTDMGPLEAQDLTAKIIARWDPAYIILVGIAGTFNKDVGLGDVVISQQVFYYDSGKAHGKRIKYRPQGYPCSMTLIRQHEALTFDTGAFLAWQKAARKSALDKVRSLKSARKKTAAKKKQVPVDLTALTTHRPKVHFGTVASGSLVVASKAKQRELLALHGKILATEMEGAGVLNATFRQSEIPTPAIVVKGISDMADKGKAAADELVYWRELAAENSARLALAMIQRGRIRPLQTDQFEFDLYRGDAADARRRIQGAVSVGMSLLAFPRLVKPLGPLTHFRLDILPHGPAEPLEVIEMVIEYENCHGRPRIEKVERSSTAEIAEPIAASEIGVYLLIGGQPDQIEFRARAWTTTKTATLS